MSLVSARGVLRFSSRCLVKKHRKVVDKLLLVGTAVLVAGLSLVAGLICEEHHISPAWLLSFWAGVGFLIAIAKTYGLRKFRSPSFAAFSVSWLLAHVGVYLAVLAYLGFLYYFPFLVAELWIGYMIAIVLFGPPDRRSDNAIGVTTPNAMEIARASRREYAACSLRNSQTAAPTLGTYSRITISTPAPVDCLSTFRPNPITPKTSAIEPTKAINAALIESFKSRRIRSGSQRTSP